MSGPSSLLSAELLSTKSLNEHVQSTFLGRSARNTVMTGSRDIIQLWKFCF